MAVEDESASTALAAARVRALPPAAPLARLAILLILAVLYAASAKLGLALAFVHPSATSVWPPTGIALAAALGFGYGVWPGILAGAFVANITTAGSAATSLGIAIGNTLEAMVGCYLVTRFANGRAAFERPQDVFWFTGLAGILSTTVSATCGVTSLALGGYADWTSYSSIWATWWLGDAAGALLVTPVLLLWSGGPPLRRPWARGWEVLGAFGMIVVIGEMLFGPWPSSTANYPLEFLSIPLLVWVAFRLGPRAAATAVLLLSVIALSGTLGGFGPFARAEPNVSLLLLQAYMSVAAMMTLVLAAAVAERRRAEEERAQAFAALREREELHRAIAELTSDFALLAEVETDETIRLESATEGFSAVTGYTLGEVVERGWLLLVHPEDLALARTSVRRLLAGERVTEEIRIVSKDGRVRWVRVYSQPFRDRAVGGIVRILAAVADVTDRRAATEVMRRQADVIRQLSTPVLRIRERLLILPVVGPVDSARAHHMTGHLLGSVRANRAKAVVIDLTGVTTMDAGVAEEIVRASQVCRALGAAVIATGVSGEIADRLAHTGFDLTTLVSKGDLQAGLEEAERLSRP
jgi:PAS domain S-box-containing protein